MTAKRPKIIGIVGGSGSGKTTVTKRIIDELTIDKVALIEQDYYYKDQSHMTMDERVKTNYAHPNAFDNELLYNQLLELIEGKAVELPVYDYVNHTRSDEKKHQEPRDVIIIEGMFGLYSENLENLWILKSLLIHQVICVFYEDY